MFRLRKPGAVVEAAAYDSTPLLLALADDAAEGADIMAANALVRAAAAAAAAAAGDGPAKRTRREGAATLESLF